MNTFSLNLVKTKNTDVLEIDNIIFSGIYYINLEIDNVKIIGEESQFEGSFIYWNELLMSSKVSGRYLIFTCVCGIADDGGWGLIDVILNEEKNIISWKIDYNGFYYYEFNKKQYLEEIEKLKKEISLIECSYSLEPLNVIFPE